MAIYAIIQPYKEDREGSYSSGGIASCYGLDGPGIEYRRGRDFPHLFRPALEPTQPHTNGYRVFPMGTRAGRGVDHPLLTKAEFKIKSRTMPLLHIWAFVDCSRVTFTFIIRIEYTISSK
jgi:hypothetical protein